MKIAFVTGATRGIGLKYTEKLLAQGYVVWAAARNPESSKELVELKRKSDHLHFVKLDVSDASSIAQLPEQLGMVQHIDLLINNAGVFQQGDTGNVLDDAEKHMASMKTNAIGPFLVFEALLPKLKKASDPLMISITSTMGSIDDNKSGGYVAYRMSKAALNMMNKTLSINHPEITAVVMCPGWVKTDMGGEGAAITTEQSVTGQLVVISKLKKSDSGKFLNYRGEEVPW